MTNGELVYYHGKMSLVASLCAVIGVLLGLYVWQPFYLIGLFFAFIIGWHLGGVALYTFHGKK